MARTDGPPNDLRVVVCSILDERRRGVESGVDAYLIKPVTPAALAATLTNVLRQPAGA